MATVKRPRVAAISLNDVQLGAIRPLCGDLRVASSQEDYLQQYSWNETDIVVAVDPEDDYYGDSIPPSVSLVTLGRIDVTWTDRFVDLVEGEERRHYARTDSENNERELSVTDDCPVVYESLATELAKRFSPTEEAPGALETSRDNCVTLVESTTGEAIAMRLLLPSSRGNRKGVTQRPVSLFLPPVADLASWFAAFLRDLHESCPSQVPIAPPSSSRPADWYTPTERELSNQIDEIDSRVAELGAERSKIENQLAIESQNADNGIRRILWADGDDLNEAANEVLSELGFRVRDMDTELNDGEPKREDLRLSRPGDSNWEAIVEVKGYTGGTKTNDSHQVRQHKEQYIAEEGRPPGLTLWLANPHRTMEPSSRPAPDGNVKDRAEAIGAVFAQTTDLFRQWVRVAADDIDAEAVIQSLIDAEPSLWTPPQPRNDS